MFEEEIKKIDEATNKAINLVHQGNFSKALKLIGKFKRSWCISESNRAITIIEALILLHKKKKTKARELIYSRNYLAWGSYELKELLRLCNPATDSNTRLYSMRLKGGIASFGMFTQFGPEHSCEIEALANSELEAVEYAKNLCRFADPESMTIKYCIVSDCPGGEDNRGILDNSPFQILPEEKMTVALDC